LSPRAAWGLLEVAADRSASWLAPSEQRRARVRASGWSLAHWAWACQRRAEVHRLYVHPSLVDRLAGDARVVRSGASARAVTVEVLLALGVVEGYVRVEAFDALVGEYALAGAGRVNVVLRVPPAELFVFGDEDEAGWPVVAVDLYDAGDDRSRRAAQSLLDRHRR
jgi:hypothetical protein